MSEGSTSWRIIEGDCRDVLATLPERSVHTCVTSPPYFGLRDYGHDGQIGLEPTPDEFVVALVDVFRGVRRVLRDDGTVWLNLGDSYASSPPGNSDTNSSGLNGAQSSKRYAERLLAKDNRGSRTYGAGIKSKDLVGIPWMVAFALRADGWYLRSDIIWSKPNPMPESVTDRPTKAHEYVFLLSKGPQYFYDADAIRESHTTADRNGERVSYPAGSSSSHNLDTGGHIVGRHGPGLPLNAAGRNKRSVWTVATQPYAGAHFATFPPKLIEPCILAGAPERACGQCGAPWGRVVEREQGPDGAGRVRESRNLAETAQAAVLGKPHTGHRGTSRVTMHGFEPTCEHSGPDGILNPYGDSNTVPGVVLDPFAGSGTTGMVALRHGRSFVGIELSPVYAAMARWRIRDDAPLLNSVAEAA